MNRQVSLVMSSFLRAGLLDLGLSSIVKNKPPFPLEVVVVNDGEEDETEKVCKKYNNFFDVKYFFSGSRNKNGIIPQGPALPNNIGIKKSSSDIIILTCPEIYHLNNCLEKIVEPLFDNRKNLVIPLSMFFDDTGNYINSIRANVQGDLKSCNVREDSVEMPFLLGIWKDEIINIGGYDEDFIGYASEDNDLLDRLKKNGCSYFKVDTQIVHLYHGPRCPDGLMWDNPRWAYNRRLYNDRKNQIVRNVDRIWGNLNNE